ncbi:MAG: recombinase family protein [Chloroflexota bacterium]
MKAVGYFLLDGSPGQGTHSSFTELERCFSGFCEQEGFEPVANFTDVASSPETGRPQYQQMLRYLRQPGREFTVLVVQHLEDLGQDAREVVQHILELEDLGSRVVCLDGSAEEPLARGLKAWTLRKRKQTMAERVKEGMRSKAIRGLGLGKTPFGYRIGLDHRFETIPEEAAIVQLIYRLYVEGRLGIRLVARHLNERGIRTRKGQRWSTVSIRDILRNRSYLGTYSRFGIRVPGNHHPIIKDDVYRKAQQRLGARHRARGKSSPPFLLSGLLFCGYCGNRMIGVSRHQTWVRRSDGSTASAHYRYYQCSSRTNQSVCHYHTKRSQVLEDMVLSDLMGYLEAGRLEELLAKKSAPTVDKSASELKRLKARRRTLERRFERYLDQAADEIISNEQLRAASGRIIEAQRELQKKVAELQEKAGRQTERSQQKEQLVNALEKLTGRWEQLTASARKALLQQVLERVVAYDDRIETKLRL